MAVGVGRADKRLVDAPLAFEVEPREPAAHRDLAGGLIDHREVHELGHAGIDRADRPLVGRDNEIAQHAHRPSTRPA